MTNRDLARLSCKVLSLFTVIMLLVRMQVGGILFVGISSHNGALQYAVYAELIPIILLLIVAALLWWGAEFFASKMVKQQNDMTANLSAKTLQSIAFCSIGLYFVINGAAGLSTLISQIFFSFQSAYRWDWESVISLVLGLGLILSSSTISVLITWLRTAGQK